MPEPPLILIVEDEVRLAGVLADYLRRAGYRAEMVHDGAGAVEAARRLRPDLIVLDLMLPGMDGLEVCREVRRFSEIPILMATARVEEIDRLLGLELGADDYLCKPYSPREVVARIKAILRRARRRAGHWEEPEADALLVLDEAGQRVLAGGARIDLTPTEYRLLRLFLRHPGQVFSRARILDQVYDPDQEVSDRVVDSHVKNLRRKLLEHLPGREPIQSVYGVGYRFEP